MLILQNEDVETIYRVAQIQIICSFDKKWSYMSLTMYLEHFTTVSGIVSFKIPSACRWHSQISFLNKCLYKNVAIPDLHNRNDCFHQRAYTKIVLSLINKKLCYSDSTATTIQSKALNWKLNITRGAYNLYDGKTYHQNPSCVSNPLIQIMIMSLQA